MDDTRQLNRGGFMKINLSKGSFVKIDESLKNGKCNVKLEWKSGIDLDLHALVRVGNKTQRVYFGNKGSLGMFPFVKLDHDAGIGNTAGDNEENLTINKISNIDEVLFYIDAYGKNEINFSNYKPTLTIEFFGRTYKVDFNEEQSRGKYFVLANIKGDKIENINRATINTPGLNTSFSNASDEELGFVASIKNKLKNLFGL